MKTFTALGAGMLALLCACDGRADNRTESVWTARRARAEPLQLWSAQMTGPRPSGRPVLICVDRQLRGGFVRPLPSAAGRSCVAFGQPVRTPHGQVFRCRIGEQRFAVYTSVQGDTGSDFTSDFTISPLDDNGPDQRQIIRFRRLGPCPAGWDPGDATDQQGRRVRTIHLW